MESEINQITPIFIFALPRSGSTLLQKIIASSDEVSTAAEPWILLPLLYSQKTEGTLSEYSHKKAVVALNDVKLGLLSNGNKYDEILEKFILSIYNGLSDSDSKYFLDKTPRYFLIIEEIEKIFPNAKFIFLFRNPLAQLASKLVTHKGRFKTLYGAAVDLLSGPNLLAAGYEKLQKKSLKITYTDLIDDTEATIQKLNVYLDLQIDRSIADNLSKVQIKGAMGDPKLMSNTSSKISNDSLHKWKDAFKTPVRRIVAIKYLMGIDGNYFDILGVGRTEIISDLKTTKIKFNFSIRDCYDLIYCYLNLRFKPSLIFSRQFKWTKYNRLS
ncbi:MAG: hypothetical protein ACI9M1_001600 [Porticoccaceae bacterium]|jgi:hypothetical protein